jgi:hypothetical protein
MNLKTQLIALVVLTSVALVHAQAPEVNLPPSPRGSAAIQVGGAWAGTGADRKYSGGSWITVDYGRPIMRGRDNIFGAGPDYGKTVNAGAPIWRAGANEPTRLVTQARLVIGGKTVAAGEYSVLVDLKEKAWTFVLSSQPDLSGATNYDPKFDVARAPMRLATSAMTIEQFTIGFADVKPDRGTLYMTWDRTIASVDFTVAR